SLVKFFSCTAKVGVVPVTQSQHGEMAMAQADRRLGVERIPKVDRIVRGITLTPGTGYDQQCLLLFKINRGASIHFHNPRRVASPASFRPQLFSECFRGA